MKKAHKKIQHIAHVATYVSVLWTLFSAFGAFDWRDGHRSIGDPNAAPSLVVWGIHFFFIGLALLAWQHERPRQILWLGAGKLPSMAGDAWRNKLKPGTAEKAAAALWLLALSCFCAAFWPGKPAFGISALLLSAGVVLNIGITKLTDVVLRRKIASVPKL